MAWARGVVNFVSEWFEVEVSRDGKVHHIEFARGIKASELKSHRPNHRPRDEGQL